MHSTAYLRCAMQWVAMRAIRSWTLVSLLFTSLAERCFRMSWVVHPMTVVLQETVAGFIVPTT